MNFNEALKDIAPKVALCANIEELTQLIRPLLVAAYRDGKRASYRAAFSKPLIHDVETGSLHHDPVTRVATDQS